MGGTTLLLLTLALPAGGAAPPPEATRAAARFEELVAAGRKEQSGLTPLLDELSTLSRSYDWEPDAEKAAAKRAELRARIAPRLEGLSASLGELSAVMRRFADEHGLETIERLSDERTTGSSDIVSIMRAQTFHQQGLTFVSRVQWDLRAEEDAWRRYRLLDGERKRFRRTLWGVSLAFLTALAALAYLARTLMRRRRPPPTTGRGGGHRRGDIIDLRPE